LAGQKFDTPEFGVIISETHRSMMHFIRFVASRQCKKDERCQAWRNCCDDIGVPITIDVMFFDHHGFEGVSHRLINAILNCRIFLL